MSADLDTLITNNFTDNIAYFKENHSDIFNKLSEFEMAVENGFYELKYELIYENNAFDVLELATQNTLYQNDANRYAQMATESVDSSVEENTFETFYDYSFWDDEVQKYEKLKDFSTVFQGIAPIIHYIKNHAPRTKKLQELKKFIFFGIGLGLHVESISQKHTPKVLFLVEDDLELFRLSMFTLNYKELAKKSRLFFSVFDEKDTFLKKSEVFLNYKYYLNHYIKFFQMLSMNDTKREQFHIAVSSQSHQTFFYNDLLKEYLKPLHNIMQNYKFINTGSTLSNRELDRKPFLLIASGPSLSKNIVWLKNNHQKFVTVALSATIKYLQEQDVHVDIITHLDAFEAAKGHFDEIEDMRYFRDAICIFSDKIPSDVLELFNKDNIFLFENGTRYKQDSLKPAAPCVGSISYQILLLLGVKNIYLLGLDMAINAQTGKTHSSSHKYVQNVDTNKTLSNEATLKYKETLFEIDGNLSSKVLTTPHFYTSLQSINSSSRHFKKEYQNVYNLSDGARFQGIFPLSTGDIKLKDKVLKPQALYRQLNKNTSKELSEQELRRLRIKLNKAKMIIEHLTNILNKQYATKELFLTELKSLHIYILHAEDEELTRVLNSYLHSILSFIFDFFNTKGLTDTPLHVEQINDMLLSHLIDICNYYLSKINEEL